MHGDKIAQQRIRMEGCLYGATAHAGHLYFGRGNRYCMAVIVADFCFDACHASTESFQILPHHMVTGTILREHGHHLKMALSRFGAENTQFPFVQCSPSASNSGLQPARYRFSGLHILICRLCMQPTKSASTLHVGPSYWYAILRFQPVLGHVRAHVPCRHA